LKRDSFKDVNNEGHEQECSSSDKPSHECVRHWRLRNFVEYNRVDVHNEHSDQSVQQDQLLFICEGQIEQSRFSIALPIHWLFKQERRRVCVELIIPQDG
jgi:hypothetical protein